MMERKCRGFFAIRPVDLDLIQSCFDADRTPVRMHVNPVFADPAGWLKRRCDVPYTLRRIGHREGGDWRVFLTTPWYGQHDRNIVLDSGARFVDVDKRRHREFARANPFVGREEISPLLLPLYVDGDWPLCPWCGSRTKFYRGGADWCSLHEMPIPTEGSDQFSELDSLWLTGP